MKKNLETVLKLDEQGQDLIEYTLLLAFVCLALAVLLHQCRSSVAGICLTNSDLCNRQHFRQLTLWRMTCPVHVWCRSVE